MSTFDQEPHPDGVSAVRVDTKPSRRINLVWIVPIIAALVGVGLAVKSFMERGPEITLQFSSADGLEAGKTKIKFKDVEVGTISTLSLAKDQKTVLVTAQLVRDALPLLVEDTRFWVVRPRVGVGGISGLGTLLSGAYIGIDPGKAREERRHFIGLEVPPVVTTDLPGREFILHADDLGSLDVGSPVYLRRIQVGRIATYSLDKDGRGVTLKVFVDAPYDKFVNPMTRFFHTSGIDLSMDDRGFKLDVQSIAALVMGGISFTTHRRNADIEPAPAKSEFTLYPDERTALRTPDGKPQSFTFIFNESVRGLRVGAAVDFRGIRIGEVTNIGVDFGKDNHEVVMVIEADIYPERLTRRKVEGSKEAAADESTGRMNFDRLVKGGLRAQLQNGSLVTGQQFVSLDFHPRAKPAQIDWSKPVPVIPTLPGKLTSLEDSVATVLASAKEMLESVNKLVQRLDKEVAPEVAGTLADVRRTLATADKVLASDAPVQQELRETLREVARAAASLRQLTDLLERQPEAILTGKKGDEQ